MTTENAEAINTNAYWMRQSTRDAGLLAIGPLLDNKPRDNKQTFTVLSVVCFTTDINRPLTVYYLRKLTRRGEE